MATYEDKTSLLQLEGDGTVPSPVVSHRIAEAWTDTKYDSSTQKTVEAFGFYEETATSQNLNAVQTSRSITNVGGHYVWFKLATVTIGGDLQIRGRRLSDDGVKDGSPTDYDFTVSGSDVGNVYMTQARMHDNVSINRISGFTGTIDYGLVSPYNAKGALSVLESAEIQFEPSDDANYRLDWLIQKFTPGAGGGVSDIMAQRTFRDTDTLKRALVDRPGNDHHLTLNEPINIDNAEGPEGVIITVNRKNMHAVNLRVRGYRQQ